MSGQWIGWVVGVVGLGAAVAAFFIVRHQRYLGALRARGWSWNSSPRLGDFLTLQVPPFGLGVDRSVDDLVTGTAPSGRQFASFKYKSAGGGSFSDRVLVLQLDAPLPTAFAFARTPRTGMTVGSPQLTEVAGEGVTVVAGQADYAGEVYRCVTGIELPSQAVLDVSIDGDRLVFIPAERDPAELAALINALDPVAAAVSALAGTRAVAPPVPAFSFYGHPDWQWIGSDDSVLDYYPTDRGGFGHSTQGLVRGLRDGIRMDAFEHLWKTTETRTVTDSEGHTHIETYTENHQEVVCGFTLPYELPTISVNGDHYGDKVRFESNDFNEEFTVRAENPKWASDVIHPRMMEWLLATRPPGWTILGRTVTFAVGVHDTIVMDVAEATVRGFLGRIQRFVWADLGLPVPPFLVE
ncbi:MAG: hypothetical protein CVT62_01950 [Actinobacteria bacterium HGW-Actinobacteria-2]|nr:MAG: hypothetical protein CVT62_01950 [Actinobacteria bacterium HGW-Actinobacteria-2]